MDFQPSLSLLSWLFALIVTLGSHIESVLTGAEPASTTIAAPPTVTISVAPSDTNTAGESYSLVCTVTVTGSLTDQPNITWLDPMDNMITSGVVGADSMSTLTFNPLTASHAGTYTCRAELGNAMDSTAASRNITVQSE